MLPRLYHSQADELSSPSSHRVYRPLDELASPMNSFSSRYPNDALRASGESGGSIPRLDRNQRSSLPCHCRAEERTSLPRQQSISSARYQSNYPHAKSTLDLRDQIQTEMRFRSNSITGVSRGIPANLIPNTNVSNYSRYSSLRSQSSISSNSSSQNSGPKLPRRTRLFRM